MDPQIIIFNYLGTGENPNLTMRYVKGAWPGEWDLGYGYTNIPKPNLPSWSVWNVYDQPDGKGNYYGTMTIHTNDQNQISKVDWQGGTDGYTLKDVKSKYDNTSPQGINYYSMTCSEVVTKNGGGGSGPFDNAPPATPMTYSDGTPVVLSVSGDQIVDAKGNQIRIKGIARPSLEWNKQGQYLSPQDIANMKGWNANVVRIDMNQSYWLASEAKTVMGSYKQIIDAMIYYATKEGMLVILDLHWLTQNQSPMANSDSITFWTQIADEYKDFGTVLFELYNEPYGITQEQWLNGGDGVEGFQSLYNAVRKTDANNVCIVGGLDYAYQLDFVNDNFKVNGTNIVYNSHPYNDKGAEGYTGPGGSFVNNFAGIKGKFPIIFTEFGDNQSGDYSNGAYEAVYQRILTYIDGNDIHYSAFGWWIQANEPQFPTLIQGEWSSPQPINGGTMVHSDLQANPGTILPPQ